MKDNKHVVGLTCKHAGMRPSISSLEYALEMLFNLCVPRDVELNGFLYAFVVIVHVLERGGG